MKLYADLHIHSRFSRATSKDLTVESLYRWAQLKGITMVGTGDCTHPGWLSELSERLIPQEEGLYALKPEYASALDQDIPSSCKNPVRFLLTGEISTIYKKKDKVRKVHHLILCPSLEIAQQVTTQLARVGNIHSDGRPIFGMDSRDLVEFLISISSLIAIIPAHIWTPHFSVLGSVSGFDSIEECYEDMTPYLVALETGLSSDPAMNWQVSGLDPWALVSNSDAHSAEKLGRECNYFDIDLSYPGLCDTLRHKDLHRFLGTIEFFPEEGKYHYDGHRDCGICWHPVKTKEQGGICPVCKKKVIIGVMNRVMDLADRDVPQGKKGKVPYQSLIPLKEVLSQVLRTGMTSKKVDHVYYTLLDTFGPELELLTRVSLARIEAAGFGMLAKALARMRAQEIVVSAGFDGQYGTITVIKPEDFQESQMVLF